MELTAVRFLPSWCQSESHENSNVQLQGEVPFGKKQPHDYSASVLIRYQTESDAKRQIFIFMHEKREIIMYICTFKKNLKKIHITQWKKNSNVPP